MCVQYQNGKANNKAFFVGCVRGLQAHQSQPGPSCPAALRHNIGAADLGPQPPGASINATHMHLSICETLWGRA